MSDVRRYNGRRVIEAWDRVFDALSAEPRRQIVVSLLDSQSGRSIPLPESASNPNVPIDPNELRNELHHNHLPKLSEMGFVEWETDPLTASRGPKFDQAAVVFEALQTSSDQIPDALVHGCQRLEQEREFESEE